MSWERGYRCPPELWAKLVAATTSEERKKYLTAVIDGGLSINTGRKASVTRHDVDIYFGITSPPCPAPPRPEPPKHAEFLLTLLIKPSAADGLLGDLEERFCRECREIGPARAKMRYWGRVLHSLRPLLWRAIGRTLKWGIVVAAAKRLLG